MDIVLREFVIFLMYAACPAHPTLPVFITLIGEEACELLILKYGAFYGFSFSPVIGTFIQLPLSLPLCQKRKKVFYVGAKESHMIKFCIFYVTFFFFFSGEKVAVWKV